MRPRRQLQQEPEADQPQGRRPPDDFCNWWYPSGIDETSGASVGGHPDAHRIWARHDPGRWNRRIYGCSAAIAWSAEIYRDEYLRWVDAGRPDRQPFVSISATLAQQQAFWAEVKTTLARIGKPMPHTTAKDLQREQLQAGQKPRLIEPLDETDDVGEIPF